MAQQALIDVAHRHLFSDRDQMVKAKISAGTIEHIIRLRDLYNYWLTYPSKRDRDIVAELRSRYKIGNTVAYEDLRVLKTLLGDLQKTTRDYHRYRFNQMITKAYEKADADNNTRDMVAAAAQYARYNQLDKEDDRASVLDTLAPIMLNFTDDPETIGIQRMPDFREKIRAMHDRYWVEATEYVDYEEVDADLDNIFNPHVINGDQTTTSLPQ